jgi:UDP-glucose-4-epimerase GalE
MDRTILVTGGAGYIGSQTCKALARAGYRPVAYDNLSRGFAELVRWGPLAEGDILDADRLSAVIGIHQPVAAVHLAALIEAGESVVDPEPFYRNNLEGTLSLLRALAAGRVGHLVFSSTAAVYGEPVRLPMDEDHPLAPVNPYGRSKLMAEQAISDICSARGISRISLRYFNAAGADPEGEIGRMGDSFTHLIPNVIKAAHGEIPALRLYGDDYPTPDGTCVRDYVHVADLADAHVAALERLLAGKGGGTFNLGTGRGWSVKEVVRTVEEVAGRRVPVEMAPRRAGDASTVVADPSRARGELGWRPVHSRLEQMARTAWEWHSRPLPLAPPAGEPQ